MTMAAFILLGAVRRCYEDERDEAGEASQPGIGAETARSAGGARSPALARRTR